MFGAWPERPPSETMAKLKEPDRLPPEIEKIKAHYAKESTTRPLKSQCGCAPEKLKQRDKRQRWFFIV